MTAYVIILRKPWSEHWERSKKSMKIQFFETLGRLPKRANHRKSAKLRKQTWRELVSTKNPDYGWCTDSILCDYQMENLYHPPDLAWQWKNWKLAFPRFWASGSVKLMACRLMGDSQSETSGRLVSRGIRQANGPKGQK